MGQVILTCPCSRDECRFLPAIHPSPLSQPVFTEATLEHDGLIHRERATVQRNVDRMTVPEDSVTVLDVLNDLIDAIDDRLADGEDFMTRLHNPKKRFFSSSSDKMELFSQAPIELGRTLDLLVRVSRELKVIRSEAIEQM